jgi:hypothetical protein
MKTAVTVLCSRSCLPSAELSSAEPRTCEFGHRGARDDVSKIGFVKRCVLANLSGQEAFAKRTEGDEPNAEFLERGYHLRFRLSPPERVFALERRNRLDLVCAADRFHASFRKSKVLHLALPDQFLHRAGNVFDGNVGIDTVLIEQIDDIGLEALQRGLRDFLEVLRTTIQFTPTRSAVGIRFESRLRGYLQPGHEEEQALLPPILHL